MGGCPKCKYGSASLPHELDQITLKDEPMVQIITWNRNINTICLLVSISKLERLVLELLEFFIILVSCPV